MTATTRIHTTTGITIDLAVMDCANCHVLFAITKDHDDRVRKTLEPFYCPSGHTLSYKTATATDLAATKARLQRAEARQAELIKERDHVERRRRAAVGKNTILKRRLGNGLCPCCKHPFPDIAAHLSSEHPGYTIGEGQPL